MRERERTPEERDVLIANYAKLAVDELESFEGILPSSPRARKQIPIHTGFMQYFPRAITAVSQHSLLGGLQHGQTAQSLTWDRSLSGDELDAMMRHIIDEDWTAVAWRAMANLEKHLEKQEGL